MGLRSLILLYTLGVSTAQHCHDGWLFNSAVNKCYSLPNTAANFSQAADICADLQGKLAVIHSQTEQTFLYDAMKRSTLKSGSSVGHWIGLSDRQSPGRWTWVDNVDSEYTNWGYGYPTNEDGANCGAMELPSGKWRNLNCDDHLQQFVCETPALTFNTTGLAFSRGQRIARAAGDDCVDNEKDCPSYASWCRDTAQPGLIDFMRTTCKKTCGFCDRSSSGKIAVSPEKACVDREAHCEESKRQCNLSMTAPLMKVNCRRTCGYCSDAGSSTTTTRSTRSASAMVVPRSVSGSSDGDELPSLVADKVARQVQAAVFDAASTAGEGMTKKFAALVADVNKSVVELKGLTAGVNSSVNELKDVVRELKDVVLALSRDSPPGASTSPVADWKE